MVARLSPQANCYLDSIAGTVDVVLSFTVPPPSSDNPVVAFPKEYFSERASIDQDLLQAAWTAVHDYIYLKLRELGAKNHFWSSLGDAETDIVSVEIDAEDFKKQLPEFQKYAYEIWAGEAFNEDGAEIYLGGTRSAES